MGFGRDWIGFYWGDGVVFLGGGWVGSWGWRSFAKRRVGRYLGIGGLGGRDDKLFFGRGMIAVVGRMSLRFSFLCLCWGM